MLSRALSLATVTLLIGCLAAIPVRAQNLEAGKSPSQIFSGTCTACHKGARGLLKTVAPGSLPGFLRQHYTTSSEMASQLSAFLIANGATAPDPRGAKPTQQAKDAKPAAPEQLDRQGRPIRPAPAQEAARPEGEPQQAAIPPGPDGRKSAAKQKLSKRSKPEESPKADAAKDEPAKSEAAKEDTAKSESAKETAKEAAKEPAKEATQDHAAKPSGEAKPAEAKPARRQVWRGQVRHCEGRCAEGERREPGAACRSGSAGYAGAAIGVGRRLQRHIGAVDHACAASGDANSTPSRVGFRAAIAAGPSRRTACTSYLRIDFRACGVPGRGRA